MPEEPSPPARPSGSGSSGNRRRRRPSGSGGGTGARPPGQRTGAQKGSGQRGAGQKRQGSPPRGGGQRRGGSSQTPRRPDADRRRSGGAGAPAIPSAAELAERSPVQMAGTGLRRAVAANRRRARAVAGAPGAALVVLGVVVGVAAHVLLIGVVAGVVAGALASVALGRSATRLVLGALGARHIDEDDAPGPWTQVEGLCASMGLGVPELFVVEDPLPNALAVGRGPDDSALVLTTGLLTALDPVALEGVLAHELSHVKANDVAPATVAAAMAVVVGSGPSAAGLVHRLAGRGREFEADRHAVGVTRYPPGLRQALDVMATWQGGGALAGGRAGKATRWLFTVVLPDEEGRRPAGEDAADELDAPAVRIAALDEW